MLESMDRQEAQIDREEGADVDPFELAKQQAAALEPPSWLGNNASDSEAREAELVKRAEEAELTPDILRWREEADHDALLVGKALGQGDLPRAVGVALQLRIHELADLGMAVGSGERSDVELNDVTRARRDLGFLLSGLTVALGARDWQAGVENQTYVYFRGAKKAGKERFESEYDTCVDRFYPEGDGDFEWVDDDGGGGAYKDVNGKMPDNSEEVHYPGKILIAVDPDKRINFSYFHELDSSAVHYRQTISRISLSGKPVDDEAADLSVRLDLDPTAPAGIALDIGRSSFRSETYSRLGDLMGKLLSVSSPETGSHTYAPFTESMVEEFKNVAEYLAVHQDLVRRRVAETNDSMMPIKPEESEANLRRVVENDS